MRVEPSFGRVRTRNVTQPRSKRITGSTNRHRHSLLSKAQNGDQPSVFICLGRQILVPSGPVGIGGSRFQDLPRQIIVLLTNADTEFARMVHYSFDWEGCRYVLMETQ